MSRTIISAGIFLSCLTGLISAASFNAFNISGISYNPYIIDVSDDGAVVLSGDQCSGQSYRTENGVSTSLTGSFCYASDMSPDGDVIVGYEPVSDKVFRWENGTVTLLDSPTDASLVQASAISTDTSTIIGTTTYGSASDKTDVACLWRNGMYQSLGYLETDHTHSAASAVSADGSVVVGSSYKTHSLSQALKYENNQLSRLKDLPGGNDCCFAWAVSADGSVIAGESYSDNGRECVIWKDDEVYSLGQKLSSGYGVSGISPDGHWVVGTYMDGSTVKTFIADLDNGIRNMGDFLTNEHGVNLNGYQLFSVVGFSQDSTKIFGQCSLPGSSDYYYYVAEIPEPATMLLSAAGGLMLYRRNKR